MCAAFRVRIVVGDDTFCRGARCVVTRITLHSISKASATRKPHLGLSTDNGADNPDDGRS